MSQTLSLEPGKYALYITPPVAGVDFTGTPLPSVSYQWKKNGTAIAGQTNATISGVWVEQSGGTVDLVDGDVISIDIILTNPVSVATKTISATIDSAIPAPVISPVSIRQLSGGTYQTVTSLANTDIGEQVIVASNTGGTVTTTPPVLTTYQWRRGYGAIAGATAQTYTLQAADADSIIDCVVTATNSGGTTTATAVVVVGTVADAGGWTALTPSADSRLIYVSNDGNDVAAASAKGRGYYLPSDPEIGPDPTNPVGPIVAYESLWRAETRLRRTVYMSQSGNIDVYGGWARWNELKLDLDHRGFPDWLLLRRGDTFTYDTEGRTGCLDFPYAEGACSGGPQWLGGQNGGLLRGRSESEPMVITAWGDLATSRPIRSTLAISGNSTNLRVVSLELHGGLILGGSGDGFTAEDILVEDCRMRPNGFTEGLGGLTNLGVWQNCRVRRCAVSGAFHGEKHNQGMFISGGSDSWTIEECVFDRNGYKENPDDATTWTGGVRISTAQPVGTGVQPRRTDRDRNIYAGGGDGVSHCQLVIRGNIFSRDGGGGSVQMRQGGITERNLFMWNEDAGYCASGPGGLVRDNVLLHDDHFIPDSGYGKALGMWNSTSQESVLRYVMDQNIATGFHRGHDGPSGLFVGNVAIGPDESFWIINNVMNRPSANAGGIEIQANAAEAVTVTGNEVAVGNGRTIKAVLQSASGNPYKIDSNLYHSVAATPFNNGTQTFAQWQAIRPDLDDQSQFLADFASFKAAAGWTAPERDIVSYMQSVDPTYVVNEDVYVDEESAVKQTVRQKVWEVLVNWTESPGAMTEAQAKLTARRYHAFITFIQRAKANRKGAWDTRWTAEAVSNYIREGFGKSPVTGSYDNRSLATRLAEYAS